MKFILVLILSVCSCSYLFSQTLNCSVKDKNEKGVPYVNIGIPSKAFGIISDDEGNFTFKITGEKDTDTLQISCIGYVTINLTIANLKLHNETKVPIHLTEAVYNLATTVVRPNEFEVRKLGSKNVEELNCMTMGKFVTSDTAYQRLSKEKGLSDKAIGIELGNKIKIDKGHQTFIDKIEFKTCVKPNDTAIYRVNIYVEGKTLKKIMTPIGMVKVVNNENVLKEGIIVKAIGKTEVHSIDLSKQNIEVYDDFIVALECIYSSDTTMNIGAAASMFGSTDLLFRASVMSEWVKIPLIDLTFIGATVTYNKKKVKKK